MFLELLIKCTLLFIGAVFFGAAFYGAVETIKSIHEMKKK